MRRSDRAEAVQLRHSGVTYQQLMQQFGMAKSTLWRWLKAEGLVDGQSQQYTERRLLAQKKAAESVHRARLERTQAILSTAKQQIGSLTPRELQLIGTALYWASKPFGPLPSRGSVTSRPSSGPMSGRTIMAFCA